MVFADNLTIDLTNTVLRQTRVRAALNGFKGSEVQGLDPESLSVLIIQYSGSALESFPVLI